ncbi:hypothetical protein H6G36_14730 [Anabaena minutissima FACHB-250]|nr:hypothetical protein [Anabaena minutissima FACHB-250]
MHRDYTFTHPNLLAMLRSPERLQTYRCVEVFSDRSTLILVKKESQQDEICLSRNRTSVLN